MTCFETTDQAKNIYHLERKSIVLQEGLDKQLMPHSSTLRVFPHSKNGIKDTKQEEEDTNGKRFGLEEGHCLYQSECCKKKQAVSKISFYEKWPYF